MSLLDRITQTPNGPCVRDTAVPIGDVLDLIAARKTIAEILGSHPELEADDVEAVLQFVGSVGSTNVAAKLGVSRTRLIGYLDAFAIPRPIPRF